MSKPIPQTPDLMRAAARLLTDAASHWDDFHRCIDEVLEVPIASGFGSTGHSSDISDPTSSAALAGSRLYWSTKLSDAQAQAVEVHGGVKALLSMMAARPVLNVDPKLKRLARCADPLCEELWVADGLCKPHYDAKRYADKKQAEQRDSTQESVV